MGISWSVIYGAIAPANAQYTTNNDGYQSNEQDATYGQGISGLNPTELIHRAKLQNSRSAEEFSQDSQSQLNDSASDFKRQQQEMILQRYQSQSESEETEEAVVE
ncbi:MAG: hypothetical protein Tsb0014_13780 [Pleurocapsa sp.]